MARKSSFHLLANYICKAFYGLVESKGCRKVVQDTHLDEGRVASKNLLESCYSHSLSAWRHHVYHSKDELQRLLKPHLPLAASATFTRAASSTALEESLGPKDTSPAAAFSLAKEKHQEHPQARKIGKIPTAKPKGERHARRQTNRPELESYLQAIGLNPDEVSRAIQRYPTILDLSVDQQVKPVLNVLRSSGIEMATLRRILVATRECQFLQQKPEEIKAVVEYFLKAGMSTKELSTELRHNPRILNKQHSWLKAKVAAAGSALGLPNLEDLGGRRMKKLIPLLLSDTSTLEGRINAFKECSPKVDVLRIFDAPCSLFKRSKVFLVSSLTTFLELFDGDVEAAVTAINRQPRSLNAGREKMLSTFDLLHKTWDRRTAAHILKRHPDCVVSPQGSIERTISLLEQLLGSREAKDLVMKYPAILSVPSKTIEENIMKWEMLVPDVDVVSFLLQYPRALMMSWEANVEQKFHFLIQELKLDKREIMYCPPLLLNHSLEKRIKPRCYKVLSLGFRIIPLEEGKGYMTKCLAERKATLYHILHCTDKEFDSRFVSNEEIAKPSM